MGASTEFRVIEDAGPVPVGAGRHGRFMGVQATLEKLSLGSAIALPFKDGDTPGRMGGYASSDSRAAAKHLGIPRRSFIGRTVTLDDGSREYRIYRVEAE